MHTPLSDDQLDHAIAALERVCEPFNVAPAQLVEPCRDDYDAVAHCRWMIDEMRRLPLRSDPYKANRHIGCVIGILVGIGQITARQAQDLVYEALTCA